MKIPKHSVSERPIPIDNPLFSAIQHVAKKHAKDDELSGRLSSLELGLPVPSLSVRYLLQNSGLPLGLIYHLVGPPATFKSTLLAEIIRWHVVCGGVGIICETETKPVPTLRKSVLGWDQPNVITRDCTSIEHWQKTIVEYIKAIKKVYESEPNKIYPVAFGIDSYMGKLSKRSQEKFASQGYTEKRFGDEALLIGDWLKVYTGLTQGWPFTLIGVNHLKKSVDPVTGLLSYRTPGGQFLQHQNVIEIRVSRSKTELKVVDETPYYETIIQLQTSKNSRGAQDKRIYVILRQWNEVKDGQLKLFSNFEWWDSTVRLLYDGWGLTSQDKELLPLIHKIIKIQRKSHGDLFWCEELGVSKNDAVTAHELGMLLESNEAILNELYKVLGISSLQLFDLNQPLVKERLNVSGEDSSDFVFKEFDTEQEQEDKL